MLDALGQITLVRRQSVSGTLRAVSFIGGLGTGFLITFIVLVISGIEPELIFDEFVVHVFFDPQGLAQTTTRAIPLILVGLGAAAAMKLRFWNIGIEGQVWAGAIAATGVALYDFGPESIRLVLMLLAAVLAGAAWIAIPVFFKVRYSVNEIIMTLLMAYVIFQVVQHLLFGPWQDPSASFPVSPHFDAAERLSRIGWGAVHTGLWIALTCGALMWVLLERSKFGYCATAVGNNQLAAKATGLPVLATIIVAVLLSGGLSGLAGGVLAAGAEYRLTQFIGHGYTFSGIVIAFLARFRPALVVVVAFLVGGVYVAGDTLKVFYGLPQAIVVLIEGTILLSLLVWEFVSHYRIELVRQRVAAP